MTEPKEKQKSGLRVPKPKKTLGLKVREMRLPHEDLIKPLERSTSLPREVPPQIEKTVAPDARVAPNTTVALQSTVAPEVAEPLHGATVAPSTRVAPEPTVAPYAIPESPATAVPNALWDDVLPTIDVYDQAVLNQLFRLSRGHHNDTCTVGLEKLAKRANVSKRQVSKSVEKLEMRGLIKRLGSDFGNKDKSLRGNVYKILIPEGRLARPATVVHSARVAQDATVAPYADNKINTQKENTQTQERVSVGSRFSLEECHRFANHLKKTGQGINNPGGYATKIFRSGEADSLIEFFLTPAPTLDITQCQDCKGTGFIYPQGIEKGIVAKCKHEKLRQ